MAFPPFPCQDLAKLVLGYLAEEQLMTAYDEFLNASPYLDVHGNEYDRIFMTSLKSILAEYRAVRIFVETCRPFPLRKKLLQCTNMVDLIKFLINVMDISKLDPSTDKHSTNFIVKSSNCSRCHTETSKCHCQINKRVSKQNSVEATLLEDLPGNNDSRRKNVKSLEVNEQIVQDLTQQNMPKAVNLSRSDNVSLNNCSVITNPIYNASTIGEKVSIIPKISNIQNESIGCNMASTTPMSRRGGDNIPDSSTENLKHIHHTSQELIADTSQRIPTIDNTQNHAKHVDPVINKTLQFNEINSKLSTNNRSLVKIKPKPDDAKSIQILSDVKVDRTLGLPNALPNATSTPMLSMQTIYINGTPVYKTMPSNSFKYTKDEIMSMPTIILVPNTTSSVATVTQSQSKTVNSKTTNACSTSTLCPLTIDITGDSPLKSNITNQQKFETDLVKTVRELKNGSLPKESTIDITTKTPQVAPPARRSSSTPRRSTHIRVLDFNTPRRILQEPIDENAEKELVISGSPNLNMKNQDEAENVDSRKSNILTPMSKENKISGKKKNWDADLRVLISSHCEDSDVGKNVVTPKSTKKKKTAIKKSTQKKIISETKSKAKTKSTNKKSKKSVDKIESIENIPVKPTINIIQGSDWSSNKDKVKSPNKSSEDNLTETPESERLSLQNAINVKLNISEILQTPFKQALYDIQMDTPKFDSIPDAPMSDFKITNIPTPRFLTSPPNAPHATPSSYSSRPTDYSSGGGSYYKPDDNDFLTNVIDLPCFTSYSNQEEYKKEESKTSEKESKKSKSRSSRPVRKCTKNVSYYNSSNAKPKDDKSDTSLSSSEKSNMAIIDIINKSKEEKAKTKRDIKKTPTLKTKSTKKSSPKSKLKVKTKLLTSANSKDRATYQSISPRPSSSKKKSKDKSHLISSSIPTKSRRKSSTPRKIHCTKQFNSESSEHDSLELLKNKSDDLKKVPNNADSDTEQLALRWSDDASQEATTKDHHADYNSQEIEDISKIQDYIEKSSNGMEIKMDNHADSINLKKNVDCYNNDVKNIERDLLDTSSRSENNGLILLANLIPDDDNVSVTSERTVGIASPKGDERIESDSDDEVEFDVYECFEGTDNYLTAVHDETALVEARPHVILKEKYCMEICIEDGISVRLRATQYKLLVEEMYDLNSIAETERAVSSITDYEKLNTPMKESMRSEYYQIFDSTLTSLDTPLKSNSPERTSVTKIVLEVEQVFENDCKIKNEDMKRRRQSGSSSDESINDSKRLCKDKPKLPINLNTASIQNMDIETVLSRLHGP